MKNLLVAQSGGPTSVINGTLVGVLQSAGAMLKSGKVFGAFNGIQGVLEETFIDLDYLSKDIDSLEILAQTPAAALGSCRYKLEDYKVDETKYETLIKIFNKHNIGYFIYIGGNDSMDTVEKISRYIREKNIADISVIGVPKTIDNDLEGTDHCPGYGSAAKYIATSFAEMERDLAVYKTPTCVVVEIMGRNAGWLTASSALARLNGGKGPGLIYLCERTFSFDKFLTSVEKKIKEDTGVLIAISEGVKDSNGKYICEIASEKSTDAFGHKFISGSSQILANLIRDNTGVKVRPVELSLLQRCGGHVASRRDLEESIKVGNKAVSIALEGKSGEMSSMKRISSDPYDLVFTSVPVEMSANHEKKVPDSYISESGDDVTLEAINYMKPLIEGEVNIRYRNGIPNHFIFNR